MKYFLLLLFILLPMLGFGQFKIFDKLDLYADVSPFQLEKRSNVHKIGYSFNINYNVADYLSAGIGLISNPGYRAYATFENVRQTSTYIDIRPQIVRKYYRIFAFGQLGMCIKGDYPYSESPIYVKGKTYYSFGLGFAPKVFRDLHLQMNYKYTMLTNRDDYVYPLIEKDVHVLSIGIVF